MSKTINTVSSSLGMTKAAVKSHVKHAAPEIVSKAEYGNNVVDALQEAINTAKEVIEDARGEQMYGTAINGLKVLAGILETQAKIMGVVDKGSGANNLHLHVAVPTEDLSKLAEDYKATVDTEDE